MKGKARGGQGVAKGWPTEGNRVGQAVAKVVNPPLAARSFEENPLKYGWPKGGRGVAIAVRVGSTVNRLIS